MSTQQSTNHHSYGLPGVDRPFTNDEFDNLSAAEYHKLLNEALGSDCVNERAKFMVIQEAEKGKQHSDETWNKAVLYEGLLNALCIMLRTLTNETEHLQVDASTVTAANQAACLQQFIELRRQAAETKGELDMMGYVCTGRYQNILEKALKSDCATEEKKFEVINKHPGESP
ncbi:hypothetical protein T439DRAFT_91944 [Meredithblackwellia eburnea MCA 4105]